MNYLCCMDVNNKNLIKYVKIQKFNTLLKFVLKYVNYLHISKIGKTVNLSPVNMSPVNMSVADNMSPTGTPSY